MNKIVPGRECSKLRTRSSQGWKPSTFLMGWTKRGSRFITWAPLTKFPTLNDLDWLNVKKYKDLLKESIGTAKRCSEYCKRERHVQVKIRTRSTCYLVFNDKLLPDLLKSSTSKAEKVRKIEEFENVSLPHFKNHLLPDQPSGRQEVSWGSEDIQCEIWQSLYRSRTIPFNVRFVLPESIPSE